MHGWPCCCFLILFLSELIKQNMFYNSIGGWSCLELINWSALNSWYFNKQRSTLGNAGWIPLFSRLLLLSRLYCHWWLFPYRRSAVQCKSCWVLVFVWIWVIFGQCLGFSFFPPYKSSMSQVRLVDHKLLYSLQSPSSFYFCWLFNTWL